ncbi:prenyltransferase/squalene oxidase repeat-containing protein [Streptomyces canus]|uniref:prenyltransferase/squalene oxidase repeat-containing protein n=1 Tax=Streptomyces canus TaxID=58343 RepID=UPI0032478AA2
MRDVVTRAEEIVSGLGSGAITSTTYPTACAARLRDEHGQPVFPGALEWLRTNQHEDGSWGSVISSSQDRLISTCAAIDVLAEETPTWARTAMAAGVSYLNNLADWRYESHDELMAFELTAAPLVDRARQLGVAVPDEVRSGLMRLRAEKLAKVPPGVLAAYSTPLLHAFDVLTELIPVSTAARFALSDGSIAASPAATAKYWDITRDPAALAYLRQASNSTTDGGLPECHAYEVFESAWVLYILTRAGISSPAMRARLDWLARLAAKAPHGLGATEAFDHPDGDDTAVTAHVLLASGRHDHILCNALMEFEKEDHFCTYVYERRPSVSVTAHAIQALSQHDTRFSRQVENCTKFLVDARHEGGWWTDKWHLSRYYPTAQAVFALAGTAPHALAGTWKWLLETQNTDGSWGDQAGKPEETAHATLAVDALADHFGSPPNDALRRAHQFLGSVLDDNDFAQMWLGRCLYLPKSCVQATLLAAYTVASRRLDRPICSNVRAAP